ncbi:MAG: polysaccharide biosynthesis tyrosine autokinase [Alphaproteobacteria bacterium]|nr:polysaccharide biosynthesis tyrosine autokinase [Alphaproteobacteria bacterium]
MEQHDDFISSGEFLKFWFFARRNAKLIGKIMLGVVVLAMLFAFIAKPRYMSEAIVMMDSRKTRVTNMEAVVSNVSLDTSAVRSEIDIISSRAVIDRVQKQLKLNEDADINPNLRGFGWLARLLPWKKNDDEAQKSETAERTLIATVLKKNLEVENDGHSYSIAIRYRDADAERAARIANAFADQYLVDQLEVKFDASQRANEWLAKRLEGLREELRTSEKAVEDFRAAHNLVGAAEETITQKQLAEISTKLIQARAELSQAEAKQKTIRNLKEKGKSASVVMASPLIQELKSQLAEVRRKEADLSARYGNRHPTMINVHNELRDITAKVEEETQKVLSGADSDLDIARSKVKSLEEGVAALKNQTGEGDQAMVTLRQLRREADANKTLYESFLARFKQVAEQQDLQMADARIVAKAEVALKPYFPNPVIFFVLSLVLGGMIGFAVAFIREYMERGYRDLNALETALGVAGLGIVPLMDCSSQLPTDYVLEKPLSIYAESIRSIRTAVHFSNVDAPPKVIMVTSSLPNEGKTIFAISFARIMAKSGARVLLIDADMRRPRVHSVAGLDKIQPDLARILSGEVQLAQAVQKDISGMDVLIARAKTPNPHDLLASKQMERLLAIAREQYDLVIIDTPPVIAVADSVVVTKLVDTTVYLVRWATTPREVIAQGIKRLTDCNAKIAGVVLNQVNLEEQKKYGDYGYYYDKYKDYYTN